MRHELELFICPNLSTFPAGGKRSARLQHARNMPAPRPGRACDYTGCIKKPKKNRFEIALNFAISIQFLIYIVSLGTYNVE
jgi:hypothetical protein